MTRKKISIKKQSGKQLFSPSQKQFLKTYWIHLLFIAALLNFGVLRSLQLRFMASTCMSTDQVKNDSRCLYIYGAQVYEKGTKSKPHKGHTCGTDITSVMPAFHIQDMARYMDPNLIANVCTSVVPTNTPVPQATNTPVPTNPPAATATPRPQPTSPPAATATPRPQATTVPQPTATPRPTSPPAATATPRPTTAPGMPTATPIPRATNTPLPTSRPQATTAPGVPTATSKPIARVPTEKQTTAKKPDQTPIPTSFTTANGTGGGFGRFTGNMSAAPPKPSQQEIILAQAEGTIVESPLWTPVISLSELLVVVSFGMVVVTTIVSVVRSVLKRRTS